MLLAGDELGHTQHGNNNAYCQDNETTWLDWEAGADWPLFEFTRRLIALRAAHPSLRRSVWLEGEHQLNGDRDVIWLNRHGGEKTVEQWEDPANHCLGVLLGPTDQEPALLVLMNAEDDDVEYTLPDGEWSLLLDTSVEEAPPSGAVVSQRRHRLCARSLAVLSRVGD
jgi:glycogen operon protein